MVRHRFLIPAFVGSNPASPATIRKPSFLAVFSLYINNLTESENLSCYRLKYESSSDYFLQQLLKNNNLSILSLFLPIFEYLTLMSLNDRDNLCQIQQRLQLSFQPEKKLKIRSLYRLIIINKQFSVETHTQLLTLAY